jgi:uncharacterized protein YndB with AHSA1/START domain
MAVGRKQRTFSRTVTIEAASDLVWEVVTDPHAARWISPGCIFTIPVPDQPLGVGALRCGWRRQRNEDVRSMVNEIVEFDPARTFGFRQRHSPETDTRITFALSPKGNKTVVVLTMSQHLYRHQWGTRENGARGYLVGLGQALKRAVGGDVPAPVPSIQIVPPLSYDAPQQTHSIVVRGSEDSIWRLIEDEDGSRFPDPRVLKSWRAHFDGSEFTFAIRTIPEDGLVCLVSEIVRRHPRHALVRNTFIEVDHELIPHGQDWLIETKYRWDPKVTDAGAVADNAQDWLDTVKQRAESPSTA